MASAILDNMYNYYLTTYGKSTVSRYDSHKKSELRSVYNNIVKINKESPLYKIKDSADAQKFAIDIKEHARDLKNVIASLSTGDSLAEAFQKKIAVSDQDDIVDADYIGNGDSGENTNSFQMEIKKLASPQLNYGNYLKDDQLAFKPGSYSFDLNTSSASYEFQFNVNPDDTNRSVQDKLAKLFNTASIGIHADVKEDDSGHSALVLTSRQTGLKDDEDFLFQILPGIALNLAITSVIAMCVGAGDYEQAHYYTKKLVGIVYVLIWIMNAVIFLLLPFILKAYHLSDLTAETTKQILYFHSISCMIVWPIAFSLPATLRAAGDAKVTMIISIASMWIFRIVFSYILGRYMGLGVFGVWVAMVIDWCFRAVFMMVRYHGGKWKLMRSI